MRSTTTTANAFTGDKFFFTDVTGQSYTDEEEDFDASANCRASC